MDASLVLIGAAAGLVAGLAGAWLLAVRLRPGGAAERRGPTGR